MDHNAKPSGDDQTLVDEPSRYYQNDRIVIEDWSQTGRGSHVDFGDDETVPLQLGRFLGRGAVGDVHEITLQGWKLAHKRIMFRRKIGEKEKKEIEILKRISHIHVVRLIGTYTQQRFLGILLYPVAVCDLHTFFDDVVSWTAIYDGNIDQAKRRQFLEPAQRDRLEALNYDFPDPGSNSASPVYFKLGCLASAIAYLHAKRIRHKDLKPSNILLSPDRLWLTDFGSATDFALLSQSATDNERGTPRYFAPEMAAWEPCGRSADIFSLGCIFLEIFVLNHTGKFDLIKQNRSADPSFHANLDQVDNWLGLSYEMSHRQASRLRLDIKDMLREKPRNRPKARDLFAVITACDLMRYPKEPSMFGDCCRVALVSGQQTEKQISECQNQIQNLQVELERVNEIATRQRVQIEAAEVHSARQEDNIKALGSDMIEIKRRWKDSELAQTELSIINQKQEEVIAELQKRLDSLTTQPKSEDQGDTKSQSQPYVENELQVQVKGRHPLESPDLDLSLNTPQAYKGDPPLASSLPELTPINTTSLDLIKEEDGRRKSSPIAAPMQNLTRQDSLERINPLVGTGLGVNPQDSPDDIPFKKKKSLTSRVLSNMLGS